MMKDVCIPVTETRCDLREEEICLELEEVRCDTEELEICGDIDLVQCSMRTERVIEQRCEKSQEKVNTYNAFI